MNVIEAEKLNIVFNAADQPVVALKDVDLTVAQGDFVSLIGPSGCGKTTLLRAIADLEQPTSGELTVNGMTPEQARLARILRLRLPGAGAVPLAQSVTRNVMLPLEIINMPRAERQKSAPPIISTSSACRFPPPLSLAALRRHAAARLHRPRAQLQTRCC
jgi:NitT/TauT family transport system ATP-binding protein